MLNFVDTGNCNFVLEMWCQCSLLEAYRWRFKLSEILCHLCGWEEFLWIAYTLKMKTTSFPKTSYTIYQLTQLHIPDGTNLH